MTVTSGGSTPLRGEVLLLVGVAVGVWVVGRRIVSADDEAVAEAARRARRVDGASHRDGLAGGERTRGHEARAVALRVGAQRSRVRAAARAAHAHAGDRRRGGAEQADLRAGDASREPGSGETDSGVPGMQGGCVEARGDAARSARHGGGAAPGARPPRAAAHAARARQRADARAGAPARSGACVTARRRSSARGRQRLGGAEHASGGAQRADLVEGGGRGRDRGLEAAARGRRDRGQLAGGGPRSAAARRRRWSRRSSSRRRCCPPALVRAAIAGGESGCADHGRR